MTSDGQHCSFVLLSEFDIDLGPKLTYQFPQPLGTDEGLLANLMLPDGAEKQLEDWTIFFLNQTSFNTIAPPLALETSDVRRVSEDIERDRGKPEPLYVLNLVRTKHDKTERRGAVVKAMAICTRHPFIQIFKPVLLMALDDYFSDPSQDCLARLFDAINSMDLSAAPSLARHEKLVMRTSDRKDIFSEKFAPAAEQPGQPSPPPVHQPPVGLAPKKAHRATGSWDSRASTDEGIVMRERIQTRDRSATDSVQPLSVQQTQAQARAPSPGADSFSLDGSVVWVGNESGLEAAGSGLPPGAPMAGAPLGRSKTLGSRGRSSTDASSSSGHGAHVPFAHSGVIKDSHAYQTSIAYKGHTLPIKMPLSTFPEEVGDYSLIQLIQTLSASTNAGVQGPFHPQLHSNGALTHPVILLFNALVTGKRIIFLGHNRPAGQVCSYVLSACALGSGCGAVMRGFIERAFPYANLINKEEWESIPGYIAGVTNPIFESFDSWDVLCDISTGRITVSKDINTTYPPAPPGLSAHTLIVRSGTLKAEASLGSEEDMNKASQGGSAQKSDYTAKSDSIDNLFIEDIIAAIQYHFGESLVRARFQEYVARFVRVAARYEEEVRGSTTIGFPSQTYSVERGLGSGIMFTDDGAGQRELLANASRIEGWQKTNAYRYFEIDFNKSKFGNPLQGFDVVHQLWRLRHARNMPDTEAELIMRTFAEHIQSYASVVELLSHMPPHQQGLLPLSFGLLHQSEVVRDLTVDIFNELRQYPVGVHFLQALNHFQRYAYVRQAHAREARQAKGQHPQPIHVPSPPYNSRTPANRSESSLAS